MRASHPFMHCRFEGRPGIVHCLRFLGSTLDLVKVKGISWQRSRFNFPLNYNDNHCIRVSVVGVFSERLGPRRTFVSTSVRARWQWELPSVSSKHTSALTIWCVWIIQWYTCSTQVGCRLYRQRSIHDVHPGLQLYPLHVSDGQHCEFHSFCRKKILSPSQSQRNRMGSSSLRSEEGLSRVRYFSLAPINARGQNVRKLFVRERFLCRLPCFRHYLARASFNNWFRKYLKHVLLTLFWSILMKKSSNVPPILLRDISTCHSPWLECNYVHCARSRSRFQPAA